MIHNVLETRTALRRLCVLLVGCAVVLSLLAARPPAARADTGDCLGPYSVAVSGPGGTGLIQPVGALVELDVLNANGALVPSGCGGGQLTFAWQYADSYFDTNLGDHSGNQVHVGGGIDKEPIAYSVVVSAGQVVLGSAQIGLLYLDFGPSGTTISTSPAGPSASQPTTLTVATTSYDGVSSYAWTFGDGTTATASGADGPSIGHVYQSVGDYTASVTVTDPLGKTDSGQLSFHVSAPLVAAFSLSATTVDVGQSVDVDGSHATTDPAGTVTGHSWDFGDGTQATGPTAHYAYAAVGTYTITHTVTDSLGRTASAGRTITVQDPLTSGPAPVAPIASWTVATTAPIAGAPTAFDATASSDPDGSVVGYAWDFGDGTSGSGRLPRHTFADGGTYQVTLTVTDDSGLTASLMRLVTVADAPPQAAFGFGPASPAVGAIVSFDGTGSSVPAGGASYAWTFGDGTSGAGATITHGYPSAGTFPVTLIVTDAAGRTSSVTHRVSTHWPPTDLAVSVAGSVPRAGEYAYRVTVKNVGHAGAHGLLLLNTLDSTQLLAGRVTAPAGVNCGGVGLNATGTITCRAGATAVLGAGKSWVVTFTVKQPAPGPVARQVTETSQVKEANTDPVTANNIARLTTTVAVAH